MEDCFRYKEYVCIILPYTPHRSLLWFLTQHYRQGLPEDMAIPIIYQILKALVYLHSNNIWHRDIKPDNVLLFDSDDVQSTIKFNPETLTTDEPIIPKTFTSIPRAVLSDLGFATAFIEDEKSDQYLGTKIFFSPELMNSEPYDQSVDIWALGISLILTLTGSLPFNPKSPNFPQIIKNGELDFTYLEKKKISVEAKDLIKRMLKKKPNERITAEKALIHPWIMSRMKAPEEIAVIRTIGEEDRYQFVPGTLKGKCVYIEFIIKFLFSHLNCF